MSYVPDWQRWLADPPVRERRRHWCRECMGASGGPCDDNDEPEPAEDGDHDKDRTRG